MLFSFATNTIKEHLDHRNDIKHNENIQDSTELNTFNLVIEHRKHRILRHKKPSVKPSAICLNDLLKEGKNFESYVTRGNEEAKDFQEVFTLRKGAPKWKNISREYQLELTNDECLIVDLKIGPLKSDKVDILKFIQFLNECQVNMKHPIIKELKHQKCSLYLITEIIYLQQEATIELRKESAVHSEQVVKIGLTENTRIIYAMRRIKIDKNGDLKMNHNFDHGNHANSFVRRKHNKNRKTRQRFHCWKIWRRTKKKKNKQSLEKLNLELNLDNKEKKLLEINTKSAESLPTIENTNMAESHSLYEQQTEYECDDNKQKHLNFDEHFETENTKAKNSRFHIDLNLTPTNSKHEHKNDKNGIIIETNADIHEEKPNINEHEDFSITKPNISIEVNKIKEPKTIKDSMIQIEIEINNDDKIKLDIFNDGNDTNYNEHIKKEISHHVKSSTGYPEEKLNTHTKHSKADIHGHEPSAPKISGHADISVVTPEIAVIDPHLHPSKPAIGGEIDIKLKTPDVPSVDIHGHTPDVDGHVDVDIKIPEIDPHAHPSLPSGEGHIEINVDQPQIPPVEVKVDIPKTPAVKEKSKCSGLSCFKCFAKGDAKAGGKVSTEEPHGHPLSSHVDISVDLSSQHKISDLNLFSSSTSFGRILGDSSSYVNSPLVDNTLQLDCHFSDSDEISIEFSRDLFDDIYDQFSDQQSIDLSVDLSVNQFDDFFADISDNKSVDLYVDVPVDICVEYQRSFSCSRPVSQTSPIDISADHSSLADASLDENHSSQFENSMGFLQSCEKIVKDSLSFNYGANNDHLPDTSITKKQVKKLYKPSHRHRLKYGHEFPVDSCSSSSDQQGHLSSPHLTHEIGYSQYPSIAATANCDLADQPLSHSANPEVKLSIDDTLSLTPVEMPDKSFVDILTRNVDECALANSSIKNYSESFVNPDEKTSIQLKMDITYGANDDDQISASQSASQSESKADLKFGIKSLDKLKRESSSSSNASKSSSDSIK